MPGEFAPWQRVQVTVAGFWAGASGRGTSEPAGGSSSELSPLPHAVQKRPSGVLTVPQPWHRKPGEPLGAPLGANSNDGATGRGCGRGTAATTGTDGTGFRPRGGVGEATGDGASDKRVPQSAQNRKSARF